MSKEAIIEKILSDAEKRAEASLNEAKDKADSILADAAAQCKAHCEQSNYEMGRIAEDVARRGKTVAELDAKKLVLAAKSELINRVYELALEKAKTLDKKTYKKLLLGMLEYAEDGDVVTISEREKGILTKEDVAAFASAKKIKLSLNDKLGDFDGGMIISGKGIDKNLTLEVEFKLLRDETEAEIAKELVG